MTKEVKAVFSLTEKEIKEALYTFYVKKLRENNINACFSEKDIMMDIGDVTLTITENE